MKGLIRVLNDIAHHWKYDNSIHAADDLLNQLLDLSETAYNKNQWGSPRCGICAFRISYALVLRILNLTELISNDIFSGSLIQGGDEFLDYYFECACSFSYPYQELLKDSGWDILVDTYDEDFDPDKSDLDDSVKKALKKYSVPYTENRYCELYRTTVMRICNLHDINFQSEDSKHLYERCLEIIRIATDHASFTLQQDYYLVHYYVIYNDYQVNAEYNMPAAFFLAMHIIGAFQRGELV